MKKLIVARCFIGFIILSRKSLGKTFKVTLDGRIQAIQEESQQFLNPNEVVPLESNEQQRLLRISLRICGHRGRIITNGTAVRLNHKVSLLSEGKMFPSVYVEKTNLRNSFERAWWS
ncbi:hypothetical protein ACFE04_025397 [Oxalis oulophora]